MITSCFQPAHMFPVMTCCYIVSIENSKSLSSTIHHYSMCDLHTHLCLSMKIDTQITLINCEKVKIMRTLGKILCLRTLTTKRETNVNKVTILYN